MPAAAFSVAPMPEPVSRYQSPEASAGSTLASFQRLFSFLWVPLSSPRDAKRDPDSAILVRAPVTSVMPLIPAGSAFGPTMTKSLYMTSKRSTPLPSATNFSSDGLAWTSSTSPSPLAAFLSAWPVPTATTRTSMPVLSLNWGRMLSRRPEFWVEVVDWTTMNSSALAPNVAAPVARPSAIAPASRFFKNAIGSLPYRSFWLLQITISPAR